MNHKIPNFAQAAAQAEKEAQQQAMIQHNLDVIAHQATMRAFEIEKMEAQRAALEEDARQRKRRHDAELQAFVRAADVQLAEIAAWVERQRAAAEEAAFWHERNEHARQARARMAEREAEADQRAEREVAARRAEREVAARDEAKAQ